ncbi:hypothetical protein V5O48_010372 [Marasmius crinis-equi]|uniref:Uncharacterized protein n=1 Tax=Marasmius crinis-equi TaxID=585013 RepID=A0ABR3F8M1_9AGAR
MSQGHPMVFIFNVDFTLNNLPESMADTSRIKHLENLVLHTWFKVIEKGHPSYEQWNSLALHITRPGVPALVPPVPLPTTSKELSQDYRSTILLHHFEGSIPSPLKMSHSELEDFKTFTSLLATIDFSLPNSETVLPLSTAQAFVSLMAAVWALLCQRKTFMNANHITDTEHRTHEIICMCAHIVAIGGVTPSRAEKVLRGGFVQTIFKLPPILHALDVNCDIDKMAIQELVMIMDCVSRLVIYNTVLRAFMKGLAKVKNLEESEENLKVQYPPLWEAWDRTKRKAIALYAIRQEVKVQGGFCGYPQKARRLFFISNVAILMFILWSDNSLNNDSKLWRKFLMMCLRDNASDIMAEVSRYVDSCTPPIYRQVVYDTDEGVDSFTQDDRLIYSRSKNPVIYLDFSEMAPAVKESPFPVPKIIDTRILASYTKRPKYNWGQNPMDGFFERWRDPNLDHKCILVFSSFPRDSACAVSTYVVFDFPFE